MGVVYQARHLKLDRIVALKVIRDGRHAGMLDRQRFTREAESVARLTHPNIVEVFDLGECEGNTFIAFEYIGGGTLHATPNSPRRSPTEVARLGEQIARAVQHAHDHGVLHRDLKPGNILMASDGTPKVGDFGLAKRLDDVGASLTATGEVCGTPQYMPPELVTNPEPLYGPTVDVYGIGAILYDLLVGHPPVTGRTSAEVLAKLATAPPPSVRSACGSIPRDLAVIVDKCLDRDPARRYPTAGAVADELARFRAGEAIRARPVGRVGKAARWCRRYPTVAGLLVGLFAAFVGATAAAVGLWRSVEREQAMRVELQAAKADAEKARDEAEAAKRDAEADYREARAAITKVAKEFTREARSIDESDRVRKLAVLNQIRPLYDLLLRKLPDDPAVLLDLAEIGRTVSHLHFVVGEYDKADQQDRAIEGLLRDLVGRFPAVPDYRHKLAVFLNFRMFLLLTVGRGHETDPHFEEAERLFLGLIAEHPDDEQHAIELAHLWHNRVTVLHSRRRFDDILPLSIRAAELLDAECCRHPDSFGVWNAQASALQDVGVAYGFLGRHAAAERYFRSAVDIRAAWLPVQTARPLTRRRQEYAKVLDNYGQCLFDLGRHREAVAVFETALPHLVAVRTAFPNSPVAGMELARCHLHIGAAVHELNGAAASLPHLDKAATILEPILAADDRPFHVRLTAGALFRRRATVRERCDRPADAAADWERAGKYQQDGPEGDARYLAARAVCQLKAGRMADAEALVADARARPTRQIEADYELARYAAVQARTEADRLQDSLSILKAIDRRGYFYPRTRQASYDSCPEFDIVRPHFTPTRKPPARPVAPAGARPPAGSSQPTGGNP